QITSLQTTLDAKETPAGAQAKVNTHAADLSLHVSPEDRAAWNAKAGELTRITFQKLLVCRQH
ncbi:hypothetical protein NYZ72_19785, partial [Acinetobacter baumannii]|nr:hypothetical protein [Acinetobacter baumannii]